VRVSPSKNVPWVRPGLLTVAVVVLPRQRDVAVSTPRTLVVVSHPTRRADLGVRRMSEGREPMRVMYERCAGVDVQKRTVVVTVVLTGRDGRAQKQTRTFGTRTADLLALAEWLEEEQVTQVALESTGV
jgi:hypothetical protein